MNQDPGSLDRLHDIVVPPPAPLWPPAPGIWILLAAVAALLGLLAWRLAQDYRANAYRRAAVAELDRLASLADDPPAVAARVSGVLKQVALVAFPRPRVASLTGEAWASFLADQAAGLDAPLTRRLLSGACEEAAEPSAADLRTFIAQARVWTLRHRPDPRRQATG